MAPSIVAVLTIGGLLGLRHAFEPDHLAAVSTLATRPGGRRLWSAGRLGLIWGLGRAVTVGAGELRISALGERRPAGEWRHCRAARRGRSRYDVAARLLRGVQRGNDRRDARRVAHSVGGRPVCRRMGRALGDDSPRGSRSGERGGGRSAGPAGDRGAVAIMTSGAAGAAVGG